MGAILDLVNYVQTPLGAVFAIAAVAVFWRALSSIGRSSGGSSGLRLPDAAPIQHNAEGPGFEPRLAESESAVLPLNHPPPAPRKKGPSAEPWPYFLTVSRFTRQDTWRNPGESGERLMLQ